MWIFLPDAFFSIVEDFNDPDRLLVRARLKGDIERHFRGFEVLELPVADYRFRALVPRAFVQGMLLSASAYIHYPDFKSQVSPLEPGRSAAYYAVWTAMRRAQSEALGETTPRVLVERQLLLDLCNAVARGDAANAGLQARAFLQRFGAQASSGDGKDKGAAREANCTGFYSEQSRG
jgi:hypothetical protein